MSLNDWAYSFLESGMKYDETARWIQKYQLIDQRNSSGWYPIHCAARGTAESVQCLLDHGAQLTVRTAMGWQPIHIAIMHGKQDIVELCLGIGGVSVNSRTNYLTTPLMTACEHRKVQLVEYLLDHGADVNATNDVGVVALFYATDRSSKQDSLAMMRLLLEGGASTSIVDVWRRTIRQACDGDKDKLRLLYQAHMLRRGALLALVDD